MPNVTATPRGMSNGESVTEVVDSVDTTSTVYTFSGTQGKLRISNESISGSFQIAVNGATATLSPAEVKEFYGSINSFSIVSTGGVQSFRVVASNYKDERTKYGHHYGYNIANGLANYKNALSNYQSKKVRIHCIGDSLTWGANASNQVTASWPGLLRPSLQNRYGTPEFGFQDVQVNPSNISGMSISWNFNAGSGWLWDAPGTHPGSFNGHSISTTSSTITGWARATFSGITNLTVAYVKSPGGGTATVTLDGANYPNISCNGSGAAEMVFSGLTTASHTLQITPNGDGIISLGGSWLESNATSGIVINNAGCASITSTQMAQTGLPSPSLWDNHPADLVIIELGANDVSGAAANAFNKVQTLRSNLAQVIDYWQSKGSSVLLLPWFRPNDSWTTLWPELVSAHYSLADQYNCALINLYQAFNQSYEITQSLNIIGAGTSGVSGASGSNAIHPGNYGYTAVARIIEPHLVL